MSVTYDLYNMNIEQYQPWIETSLLVGTSGMVCCFIFTTIPAVYEVI